MKEGKPRNEIERGMFCHDDHWNTARRDGGGFYMTEKQVESFLGMDDHTSPPAKKKNNKGKIGLLQGNGILSRLLRRKMRVPKLRCLFGDLEARLDALAEQPKGYDLSDPIARRMFCRQSDWKQHRRHGQEGPVPEGLKKIVLDSPWSKD